MWYESTLSFLTILFDLGMIFCPLLGYLLQYIQIIRLKSSEGFSQYVSCILIASNIFRVFFWIGKPFGQILLWASVVMILGQFGMIEVCVRHKKITTSADVKTMTKYTLVSKNNYGGEQTTYFNNFKQIFRLLEVNFVAYIAVFVFQIGLLCILASFFNENMYYVESLGIIYGIYEAALSFPQLIRNCNRKSTTGFNLWLLAAWTIGDALKTTYYIIYTSPLQLTICSLFQFSVNIFINGQVVYYSRVSKQAIGANGEVTKRKNEDIEMGVRMANLGSMEYETKLPDVNHFFGSINRLEDQYDLDNSTASTTNGSIV